MPGCRYVEEIGLATMLMAKRPASVTPEGNLREHVTHTPLPSANKAACSGFEAQRRCHQKSKTGVSVARKKDLCPPKIKRKSLSRLFERLRGCSIVSAPGQKALKDMRPTHFTYPAPPPKQGSGSGSLGLVEANFPLLNTN